MKTILTASATALALLLALPVSARPPGGGPEAVDQRLERMVRHLDLDADQQAQIRAILEAQAEDRRAARAAVHQEIDAVLTEEQRRLRDERRVERIDRRVARLADRLDLTAEQEAELKTRLRAAAESGPGDRSAMREELAAVLTEDQLEALDDLRDRRRGGGYR